MPRTQISASRVVVDGKFFRLGGKKFYVKGVTYGPFAPTAETDTFASPAQTARDFAHIREMGANVVRTYYCPPVWLLDLAVQYDLKVFIDIPWPKHLCFLDDAKTRATAMDAVRGTVGATKGHSAVFAYSVVNEIPPEIARWSGVQQVERFIEELVAEARSIDSGCLCTFASFPPTEYLQARNADFVCFNVYLHHQPSLEVYLARLQTLAESRPLLLAEFGMDSFREGEAKKCEFLSWQIETAFRGGLAGTVLFSYTDDWYRGGCQIEDWAFGVTDRERKPKDSYRAVRQKYELAPYFSLPRAVRASVVVATYNGQRTLKACLESLSRLNYPDYEIIVVDDGSTDATPEIAKAFPSVRYLRQSNQGLSVARNSGIAAASGEVVAFTDDDCRVDEDWLHYAVTALLRGNFVAVGGHNFLPPEDSCVAAAVALSPGGPAHVMITDSEAEHIPGCNMAFYKWALEEIGGFDPIFRKAGDDVDVCWRLQQRGYKIGFSPAGFVWHYRRSTVKAYLKQQAGYGEAEALLAQRHPEYFSSLGGGIWRGRIYGAGQLGLVLRPSVIYRGIFGSAPFQRLYSAQPSLPFMLCTSLGYHIFILAPLIISSLYWSFALPTALVAAILPVAVCVVAAAQAAVPPEKVRFWSRPLIALLFFLQPIVRGWARFKWRLNLRASGPPRLPTTETDGLLIDSPKDLCYWSERHADRYAFLNTVLRRAEQLGVSAKPGAGWDDCDAEVLAGGWSRLRLITVTEEMEQGRRSFRCRLQARWSLRAKILFWLVVAIQAALLTCFASDFPELWVLPVSLVLLVWFLEEERETALMVTAVALDDAARTHALVRV